MLTDLNHMSAGLGWREISSCMRKFASMHLPKADRQWVASVRTKESKVTSDVFPKRQIVNGESATD
jgi:hypothetical protein